jgi:hypothetical protein
MATYRFMRPFSRVAQPIRLCCATCGWVNDVLDIRAQQTEHRAFAGD